VHRIIGASLVDGTGMPRAVTSCLSCGTPGPPLRSLPPSVGPAIHEPRGLAGAFPIIHCCEEPVSMQAFMAEARTCAARSLRGKGHRSITRIAYPILGGTTWTRYGIHRAIYYRTQAFRPSCGRSTVCSLGLYGQGLILLPYAGGA